MPPATTYPYPASTRRGLIIHDVLAFLALLATTVALFGVTLFLFRSFEQRRVDLGREWERRGRIALQQNHPEQAVAALRTALSYTPDGPTASADQLLLAQALAAAGHTDEATNYFLNLWEAHPGDGFINLQLARLARQRHEDREASDYYRASIFGSWQGDGILRRREVRLELADFLIEQHLNAEARNELFTVAGNAPENVDLNLTVAARLEAAGYLPDAYTFLKKAVDSAPHDRKTLVPAAQAAYQLGDYTHAESLANRALEESSAPAETQAQQQQLVTLADNARRIQQLTLSRDQPAHQRALHLAAGSQIAEARLHACIAASATSSADASLVSLLAQWTALEAGPKSTHTTHKILIEDPTDQDTWTQLVYRTEQITAQTCETPTGDDALLLQLANAAEKAQGSNGK